MKRLTLALCLVLLICVSALAEETLTIAHDGKIVSYGTNAILIGAPAAGELTVTVRDAYSVFRILTQSVEIGETAISWDGLREDGQRLGIYNGTYQLDAILTAPDGRTWQASAEAEGRARQTILYALPSSDTLYLGGGDGWFAEICLLKEGTVVMTVADAKEPDKTLLTRQYPVGEKGQRKVKWNGKIAGKAAPAGDYIVRFRASSNPDAVISMPVRVVSEAAPAPDVAPTGAVLPEAGASDEEIWTCLRKPRVVVDILNTNHQKVYALPDSKSDVLGTLHGQSQGLEVLAIEGSWARVHAWQHEDASPVTGYVPLKNLKVVFPNGPYGLVIDKSAQTLTLYENGVRVTTLPVSTGLPTASRLIRETAAGTFLTDEHLPTFTDTGYNYGYPIRYDGGNLIHQLGYRTRNRHADYSDQQVMLGHKASHGCIRIPERPLDESGVDAYWLWTHLPWHTPILILDDPAEREELIRTLTRTPVPETPVPTATPVAEGQVASPEPETPAPFSFATVTEMPPVPAATPVPDLTPIPAAPRPQTGADTLTLTLGGDAALGIRENWWRREDALPAYLNQYGFTYPFSGLQSLFAADDMTFINLECVLKSNRKDERTDKTYRFRGLPTWTGILTEGSVEQVNIANNHYIDYNAAGKLSTRRALTAAGIPFSGYTFTYIWEQNGHKIGFAGIRETMYLRNKKTLASEIIALREAGCEVVIYSCHWGTEYEPKHNETQLEMAMAAAQAGADLIVGTHPHCVQGLTAIDGVPVIWSLGNLVFGGTIELTLFDATLARVRLQFEGGAYRGCSIELIPILTSGRAAEGMNDYRPVVAENEDKARILSLIQADSDLQLEDVMFFPAVSR